MTKLKLLTAQQWHKLLTKLGFELVRVHGSHAIYLHEDGRRTVIPRHGSRLIARPLTSSILNQLEVDVETYTNLSKGL